MIQRRTYIKRLTEAEVGMKETNEIYIRLPNDFDYEVFFQTSGYMNGTVRQIDFKVFAIQKNNTEITLRFCYYENAASHEKRIPSLATLFKMHSVAPGDVVILESITNNNETHFEISFYKDSEFRCSKKDDQYTYFILNKNDTEQKNHDLQAYLEFPIFDESFVQSLNDDQIVQKLASILKQEWEINGYVGVHYFGFKYSKLLRLIKASPAEIIRQANNLKPIKEIPTTYNVEISKTIKVFECAEKDNEVKVTCHDANVANESSANQIVINPNKSRNIQPTLPLSDFTPAQIIYYGVPGCGKSHQIQEDLKKKNITEENHQVKRVVFHPDYCNADFVGQILPVTKRDGGIRYQFKAGPFTKILRDAYANPDKEYALIIEEINRGNAAAIFGDLFQLLDRKRESDPVEVVNGNSYGPGWSDYCVENDYINAYFRGAYDEEDTPNPLPPKTLGNITFNDNVDIRLPPNLSLYATMNTSDQNVFTLDNAFQRRWEMKQIPNNLSKEISENLNDDERKAAQVEVDQYNEYIGETGVKWGVFRDKINEIIMQSAEENGLSSMEDKRLGGWFIVPKKASDAPESAKATITSEAFAEKVLKYLWDDAFKFDRKSHFGDVKTLEELIEKFKTDGFKVFSDEQISGLSQNGSASTQTGTSES